MSMIRRIMILRAMPTAIYYALLVLPPWLFDVCCFMLPALDAARRGVSDARYAMSLPYA